MIYKERRFWRSVAYAASSFLMPAVLLASTSAPAGEEQSCRIMSFIENGAIDFAPQPQSMPAVRMVILKNPSEGGTAGVAMAAGPGAAGPGAAGPGAAGPRDEAALIRDAIARRDTRAFLELMPANPQERRELLQKTYALDGAFRNTALPIVRQILLWQPDALSARPASSKAFAIEAVASNWASIRYFQTHGVVVANPPADDDYVELLRLLLDAGASADGGSDWRPPLGIVASLPASAATMKAGRLLIEAGANVNAPRAGAQPPLVFAAETGNAALMRLMLDTHRATQESLDAALVKTSIAEANEALPMLLEAGADINTARTPTADPRVLFTPMANAARRYRTEHERRLVQLMIRYRADPNRMMYPGRNDSPLMDVTPDVELMSGLLTLGADPNYRNAGGHTALLAIIQAPESAAPASARAPTTAAVNAAGDQGVRYRAAALLLNHGADVHADPQSDTSPLKETRAEDAALVSLLIAHGATWQLNDKDLQEYRAYQVPMGRYSWAVLHHKDALAAGTLEHGEAVTAEDCGVTYYAAASGAAATLNELIHRREASSSVHDLKGLTPLLAAAGNGHLKTLQLLLDNHLASVNERSPVTNGSPQALVASLALGANLYTTGGTTALMLAASANRVEVAEELIRRGADVNVRDAGGHTALDYADQVGHGVSATLRAHGAVNGEPFSHFE